MSKDLTLTLPLKENGLVLFARSTSALLLTWVTSTPRTSTSTVSGPLVWKAINAAILKIVVTLTSPSLTSVNPPRTTWILTGLVSTQAPKLSWTTNGPSTVLATVMTKTNTSPLLLTYTRNTIPSLL